MVGPSGRGVAKVSIKPEDLSTAKLACVASRLSETHPSWGDVSVWIFDSADAAKHFSWNQIGHSVVPEIEANQAEYEKRWRATYTIDAVKDEAFLLIPTLSWRPERYETRIDLPLKGKPRCRFDVADRCLISAGAPDYPEAVEGSLEGSVRVDVLVTPRGTISSARVAEVESGSADGGGQAFARAAIENVKTWRFDPAEREDAATINYRFEFVDRPRALSSEEKVRSTDFGLVEVRLTSGTDVTVRRFTSTDSN